MVKRAMREVYVRILSTKQKVVTFYSEIKYLQSVILCGAKCFQIKSSSMCSGYEP